MPQCSPVDPVGDGLDAVALRGDLRARGSAWQSIVLLDSVASTNAEVAAAAHAGEAEGLVLVAEEQTRGRGRLDRSWVSPRGSGLTVSTLLRPSPPTSTWGWIPLAAGVALVTAVRSLSTVDVGLKWPNDLLLGPAAGKAAGILAESAGAAVVVGVGVNVSAKPEELPPAATSLLAEGAPVSRHSLLVEWLLAFQSIYAAWVSAGGDAVASGLMAAYGQVCTTIGQRVAVTQPHGRRLYGLAEAVDVSGGLIVATEEGRLVTVVAADVVHVRPVD